MADRETISAGEAARALGISLDTLRRWDKSGRIQTVRDSANRRQVPTSEIERLRGSGLGVTSALNEVRAVVRDVRVEGLLVRVEVDVAGPVRLIHLVPGTWADSVGLRVGSTVTVIANATSLILATDSPSP